MKKRILSCAIGLFFASTNDICAQSPHKNIMTRAEKRQRMLTAYISSLIISGGIGAITGGVVRYLEKKLNMEACPIGLFLTLLGWALESEFRNDVLVALQRDLDQNGIDHKKGLMFKSAWIASWLSYLHV
jgi:hypothetical protein